MALDLPTIGEENWGDEILAALTQLETDIASATSTAETAASSAAAAQEAAETAVDGLAAVATSGDYDDLTNTPTIPTTAAEVGALSTSYQPTAANISDSTATGRSVLTAASASAARTAIGAGTSSLALGTSSSTAKAGNYTPPIADLPAGVTLTVRKSTTWPVRPTARTDITVRWVGPDPSPAIVSSGTGGMLDGVDERVVTE